MSNASNTTNVTLERYDGKWEALREGSVLFKDSDSRLLGVPSYLKGKYYYKGPMNSGKLNMTLKSCGTVWILASNGNPFLGGLKLDGFNRYEEPLMNATWSQVRGVQ